MPNIFKIFSKSPFCITPSGKHPLSVSNVFKYSFLALAYSVEFLSFMVDIFDTDCFNLIIKLRTWVPDNLLPYVITFSSIDIGIIRVLNAFTNPSKYY